MSEQRESCRHFVAHKSRLLVLFGRAGPNLAIRLLELAAQRLREDFPRVHNHPVLPVETFGEPTLDCGTGYQAASARTHTRLPVRRPDYYEKHDRPKELFWGGKRSPRQTGPRSRSRRSRRTSPDTSVPRRPTTVSRCPRSRA
jgi:hypothetical protein